MNLILANIGVTWLLYGFVLIGMRRPLTALFWLLAGILLLGKSAS